MRRRARIIICAAALLLAAEAVTYVLLAEEAMPSTFPRAVWLHGAGTADAFICIEKETWDSLSPAHQRALDEVLGRRFRTVYHSRDEIPPERMIYLEDKPEELAGIDRGCIIKWEVKRSGLFFFTGRYGTWMSLTGAEWKTVTYVWLPGVWVKLWTHSWAMA